MPRLKKIYRYLIISRRFSSEKSPTITMASFFRQTTDLTVYVLKSGTSSFLKILQQTREPKSLKGLPFYVFRHYETVQNSHFSFLFRKFQKKSNFFCLQKVPFNFLILCKKLDVQQARRVPPFTVLKTLRFLSLIYSADFRRARLVSRRFY